MKTASANAASGWVGLSLILAGGFVADREACGEERWTLRSPDEQLRVTLQLKAADEAAGGGRLSYSVDCGGDDDTRPVLLPSPLGIVRSDQNLDEGLRPIAVGEAAMVDESYRLLHGKRSECRSQARQQSFTFANARGAKLEVIFRVSNDGVAFRYRFPETDAAAREVLGESSGFRLPAEARAWIQPYQEPSMWTPSYEDYFADGIPAGTSAPTSAGWCLPALFQSESSGCWLLLAEAAVDGTYCGCRLEQNARGGQYRIRFPEPADGNGTGRVTPRSSLPWQTPWRVILVSRSLAGIVESTLVTDLNPPSRVADTAWIQPGRVSWSWWSDHDSPRDFAKLREFVDLAAELGWEYSLVDANWTLMDGGNVRELAKYAQSKGVGLMLWYNSGGPHNSVTEKPRGCLDDSGIRKFEFELLQQWGVRGVKVDFFQSDKQNVMQLYQGILEDAAAAKILVNFHGCTAPRGWSRTWPHLMTMEAVKGAECYTFGPEYPEKAPSQNTILPFTRNVVGPMDYTPVTFSHDRFPHLTSNAHELALTVVFESGLLHFADRVSAYRGAPDPVRKWLREIPVAWDETRLAGGYPGQWVAVARRKGNRWYVGGINGQNQPQDISLEFEFLAGDEQAANWIGDAPGGGFDCRKITLSAARPLELQLPPRGGFVLATP